VITLSGLNCTYPLAFVETNVDDAPEEDEVAFRKFEGLELGAKQIAVLGEEVLKEVWINGAPAKQLKIKLLKLFVMRVIH